jgi:hypothetical protein
VVGDGAGIAAAGVTVVPASRAQALVVFSFLRAAELQMAGVVATYSY